MRGFNRIASLSSVNFRAYFISIKPTRNSRDKQFSSMVEGSCVNEFIYRYDRSCNY